MALQLAALLLVSWMMVPPVGYAETATINFDVSDSGYINLPESIPAGRVTLVMRNIGQAPHHAKLVKLNEGVSIDDYQAAVLGGQPTGSLVTTLGGNGVVDPAWAAMPFHSTWTRAPTSCWTCFARRMAC